MLDVDTAEYALKEKDSIGMGFFVVTSPTFSAHSALVFGHCRMDSETIMTMRMPKTMKRMAKTTRRVVYCISQ